MFDEGISGQRVLTFFIEKTLNSKIELRLFFRRKLVENLKSQI